MTSYKQSELGFDIGFYSSIIGAGTNMGYGYTAVQLIEAWQRKMHPVWWSKDEAAIGFSYVQPYGYDYEIKTRPNIGYTPWESTQIPKQWLFYIDKMTELWTTSNACKEWYRNGGVEIPIRVLPHGINRNHWTVQKRECKPNEPLRFLHIGSETKRKGGQMAYESFKHVFGDSKDVSLILKGYPQFEIDPCNVQVVRADLPLEELVRLYHKCHVLVYPGNGEGFGLIPFQGAATGMPTIVTNWGGHLDYIKHCLAIGVKDLIECDYEPHEGFWALPNQDDLESWMQDIHDYPEDYFEDAYKEANRMTDEYSWDLIAETSLSWMEEILESF